MKFEEHQKRLRESLDVIEDCVQKGALDRQRNIGFNVSAAAVDMLEMLLHTKNLISPGVIIKHDWFSSTNKINEKLSIDFPNKKEIIKLMHDIETKRNILCYGKTQKLEIIQETLQKFNILKNIFKELNIHE